MERPRQPEIATSQSGRSCVPAGTGLGAGVGQAAVRRFVREGRERTVRAGEHVFLEGDPPDGLYVILSGLLRVWTAGPSPAELTLALLEPGDVFGEAAIIEGGPRSASVTALRDSRVVRLPAGKALELIAAEPDFARALLDTLCERLRRANAVRWGEAFLDLEARLAECLCDLAFAAGEVADGAARIPGITQSDLARMLGVSREAINKRLKSLAARGLVRVEAGTIVSPDISALRRAARSGGGGN